MLDSNLRTPADSKLVTTANDDVLIFFTQASSAAQQGLKDRGIRLERLAEAGQQVSMAAAIKRLGAMEITSVLFEGGAEINAAALNEDVADRLVLFYAPIFLGADAVPMIASSVRPRSLEDLLRNSAAEFTLRKFAGDFALEAYLRNPWNGVT